MRSPDDHILAARRHALSMLDMYAAEHGDDAAKALAAGLTAGVRNYLLGKYGPRATYLLFQGLADDVISPELTAGYIEGHIADMLRKRRSA